MPDSNKIALASLVEEKRRECLRLMARQLNASTVGPRRAAQQALAALDALEKYYRKPTAPPKPADQPAGSQDENPPGQVDEAAQGGEHSQAQPAQPQPPEGTAEVPKASSGGGTKGIEKGDPNQPRMPAGSPQGGQFASFGGGNNLPNFADPEKYPLASRGALPLAIGAAWNDLEDTPEDREFLLDRSKKWGRNLVDGLIKRDSLDELNKIANDNYFILKEPITVYWGVGARTFAAIKPDGILQSKGVRSLAFTRERAELYGKEGRTFEVTLPKGTRVFTANIMGEPEAMMLPSSKFKIIGQGKLKVLSDGTDYIRRLYSFRNEIDGIVSSIKAIGGQAIIEKSLTAYSRDLRGLCRVLWNGGMTKFEFVDGLFTAMRRGLAQAWQDGRDRVGAGKMTDEDMLRVQDIVSEQAAYAPGFADFIEGNNKASGGKFQSILPRATMWMAKYEEVSAEAMAEAQGEQRLRWKWNPAIEKHCVDCEKLNNRIYTAATWSRYGLHPKAYGLKCGPGRHCGCEFQPTKAAVTPGRPPVDLRGKSLKELIWG